MFKILLWINYRGFTKVPDKNPNYIAYQYQLENIVFKNKQIVILFEFIDTTNVNFSIILIDKDNLLNNRIFTVQEQVNLIKFNNVVCSTEDALKLILYKLYDKVIKFDGHGFPNTIDFLFDK